MKEGIRPGRWPYAVSATIFIASIILFVVVLMSGINKSMDKLDNQVVVPGSSIIELEESGKYNIYIEHKSVVDGKVFHSNSIDGLMLSLTDHNTGQDIKLSNPKINMNYNFLNREGYNIFEFSVDEPGKYELTSWFENGESSEAVLVIERGFATELTITIVISILIICFGFGGGLIVFIFTLYKRSRAKKGLEV